MNFFRNLLKKGNNSTNSSSDVVFTPVKSDRVEVLGSLDDDDDDDDRKRPAIRVIKHKQVDTVTVGDVDWEDDFSLSWGQKDFKHGKAPQQSTSISSQRAIIRASPSIDSYRTGNSNSTYATANGRAISPSRRVSPPRNQPQQHHSPPASTSSSHNSYTPTHQNARSHYSPQYSGSTAHRRASPGYSGGLSLSGGTNHNQYHHNSSSSSSTTPTHRNSTNATHPGDRLAGVVNSGPTSSKTPKGSGKKKQPPPSLLQNDLDFDLDLDCEQVSPGRVVGGHGRHVGPLVGQLMVDSPSMASPQKHSKAGGFRRFFGGAGSPKKTPSGNGTSSPVIDFVQDF